MIRLPGYLAREHAVTVPLDHSAPDGATIDVFARELVDPGKQNDDLPYLLFLQGGPGGKAPRPLDRSAWIDVALRTHRVVLLDQRGTGRSTPITAAIARDRSAPQVADYLSLFRADAIVADAEVLRRTVIGDRRWDTLDVDRVHGKDRRLARAHVREQRQDRQGEAERHRAARRNEVNGASARRKPGDGCARVGLVWQAAHAANFAAAKAAPTSPAVARAGRGTGLRARARHRTARIHGVAPRSSRRPHRSCARRRRSR